MSFISFCVGSGKSIAGEAVAAAASEEEMEKRKGVAVAVEDSAAEEVVAVMEADAAAV